MIMLVCPAHVVQVQMFVHVGCEFVFVVKHISKSFVSLICVVCTCLHLSLLQCIVMGVSSQLDGLFSGAVWFKWQG